MSLLDWVIMQYSLPKYTVFTTAVNVFVAVVVLSFVAWAFRKYSLTSVVLSDPNMFVSSIFGWVLFGVSVRVLKDLGLVVGEWRLAVITPFIYVEVLALSFLVFVFFYERKREVWKWGGYLLSLPFLIFDVLHAHVFRITALVFVVLFVLFFVLLGREMFSDSLSVYAFVFQMLDGISTFISLTFYGFGEEHLVPNLLMRLVESNNLLLFGSSAWVFLVVKFLLVVGVLKLIDKLYAKEDVESVGIKLFIAVLGMAVGMRNVFNLVFV